MIKSVFNKIKSNLWMFACLVIGSLLITAIISSIPMYTAGTLRQMLAYDLEHYAENYNKPGGQMYFTAKIPSITFGASRYKEYEEMESVVIDGLEDTTVGVLDTYTVRTADKMAPVEKNGVFYYTTSYSISTYSGIEDHISMVQGEYVDGTTGDGVLDVVINESMLIDNPGIMVGETYDFVSQSLSEEIVLKLHIVGVFAIADESDTYWYETDGLFDKAFITTSDEFEDTFYHASMAAALTSMGIYQNLDFAGLGMDDLSSFVTYYKTVYNFAKDYGIGRGSVSLNAVSLLNSYMSKSSEVNRSLWVLNVPVIAMLAFYMVMISRMIIEEDKNEISTFKSRGAKTIYIFLRYVVECGFISAFSLLLGPVLGFVAAKFIGAASGFLEFNSRDSMVVKLSGEAYLYAVIACLIFVIMILVPAISATRKTIVNLKHQRARKSGMKAGSRWLLFAISALLIITAVGLLYIYQRTGGFNVDGTVDPIVYVISSLFILGCGMLFITIYPIVISIVFKIFKRILTPSVYSAFIQVSRGGSDCLFLMLFLIMTISVGIYSSGSARIINNNVEHTVLYEYGADAIVEPDLSDYAAYTFDEYGNATYVPTVYREYPLDTIKSLSYVDEVARVGYYQYTNVSDAGGLGWHENVTTMAIDPYEFAQVAWLGDSLNDGTNWYSLINEMESHPTAVVISSTLAERTGAEVGSTISLDINNSNKYGYEVEHYTTISCYVCGIVDYWPTYISSEDGYNKVDFMFDSFVVMNFDYLYSVRSSSDYYLFMSLKGKGRAGEEEFAALLQQDGVITDSSELAYYRIDIMEEEKSDSMLKGLNGCFSIGFISTLVVSFVGFLIYWIMSVRKRKLQFGILRAMGLTKAKMTLMLTWEHLLTTGVSVVMGILIGALAVRIYTPLLKIAYSDSLLPLEIVFNRSDNLKIYAVVILMIVTGIVVLSAYMSKLKINEAVKIGEE